MPKLIAIIDDEAEMEFFYSLVFEKALKKGLIKLKFFQDSRDFFEWFIANEPDLILSDINMPYISGPELSRTVRQMGRMMPIYFVSGFEENDYQDVLSEIDVCRFLTKPLNPTRFHGLLELDLNLPLA